MHIQIINLNQSRFVYIYIIYIDVIDVGSNLVYKLFYKLILLRIIKEIFNAKMEYRLTKKVDLISWASIRDDPIMHNYIIKNIDNTLNIHEFLKQIPTTNNRNNSNRHCKKDSNRLKIIFTEHLENLLNNQKQRFFVEFNQLNIPYFRGLESKDLYGFKGIYSI